MFFSPTSTDEKMNEMQVSEKNRLVKRLFPFNSEENIEIYQEVFSLIPNKLLNLMLNDNLEIILSELEPTIEGGGMLTGYYERSDNRISDNMLEEINYLGLSEFSLNYVKNDDFEIFATLFEFFIHDYEKLKTNAPISFGYITYYLEKLLIG